MLHVGSLEEVRSRSPLVVSKGPVPIVIFHHDGELRAVDNRCPHMGFPLHRGTVEDGILTCYWHHARFDLVSGCTFNLFADDVDSYGVEVRDGQVYLDVTPPAVDPVQRWSRRLKEGMEQNLSLIVGKSVVGLHYSGVSHDEVARQGALYGVRHRRDWSSGLTILSAMANVCDLLEGTERIPPLYHGLVHVARDCAGRTPKFEIPPLRNQEIPAGHLKRWFRYFVEVRSTEGAERCLLTAIHKGMTSEQLTDLVGAAATDHVYLDGGHVIDFVNKAFELLDRIGWEHAGRLLPALIQPLCLAVRSEERNPWRHPIDLVPVLRRCRGADSRGAGIGAGKDLGQAGGLHRRPVQRRSPHSHRGSVGVVARGCPSRCSWPRPWPAPRRCASSVFTSRTSWPTGSPSCTPSPTPTPCINCSNATSPRTSRRGVFHGAMRVYLDRFFNIPPARLPSSQALSPGELNGDSIRSRLLTLMNHQQETDRAGQMVWSYLEGGGSEGPLISALTESLMREDANFHTFQMLEAAVRQYGESEDPEERNLVMAGAARYLAAHAPTQRAMNQTLRVAIRLHRGDPVYEPEGAATRSGVFQSPIRGG